MKDLLQCLYMTCHSTNNNSIHLKSLKFAIAFSELANELSCHIFSKNENGKKLIVLRVPLVKMFIVTF